METSYIKEYYNNYNEDQRTKSRHGSVEFITNMKYIRDFLPAGASILDVGAGTGVYSMALAMDGYHVRAIELVEHNIEVFRANLKECGAEIPVEQGNAMDLSRFPDESFDGVLLFGPLYHLYFAAYCMNEATIIHYCFQGDGSNMLDCLTKGMVTADYHCISQPADLFEMVRLEDIDRLNQKAGLERVKIVASDLFSIYIRDQIDSFSDAAYHAYINYHLSVCERGDLIGATNHSLDILRKK